YAEQHPGLAEPRAAAARIAEERKRPFVVGETRRPAYQDRVHVTQTRQQPAAKVQLHSAGAASRLAALLLVQILPVFSLVAPCHPGASPPSVRRWTFTTGC